ncbi:MAG: hypothetical protein M3Y84_13015 [Acidobacteriota bacterium]|nr:hypothetical protein [Acidobacteriota bacterium]
MSKLIIKLPFWLGICLVSTLNGSAFAQKKTAEVTRSPSCNQQTALEVLQQQIAATKTFDDTVQRIGVLIRAADMLWPYLDEKARANFSEAFDLATSDFKEKGDEQRREGVGLVTNPPDQRYAVISAIAKRDPVWARKLTDQMLRDQQRGAEEKVTKDTLQESRTAEKLLSMASSLAPSDQTAALGFASSSLRYPATLYLPLFLYRLSEVNRAAADQFYLEALAAYAEAPMDRLLYLSSYPFGNDREAGEMPGYTIYDVPTGFAPNPKLQRSLVQILLRRVQQRLQHPPESASGGSVSEAGQMWLALTRLEKQVQRTLPDLAAQVEQAKGSVFALLPQNSQSSVSEIVSQQSEPIRSFNEQVEAAEKNPNVDRRDQQLVFAVIGASANEDLDLVLRVIDKISDSSVRPQLLNWLYFSRTQSAIKNKQPTEARKLAGKVDELDQRGYLFFQIAEESLKQSMDQTQAREMLEEVVASTAKAPATMVTARTQLGVAYLYTKIDLNRAIAVLGDAVKNINRIEQPDFSRQFVVRKIEGKTFGSYASFQTPGFSVENAFREVGKLDIDGTLYQASNFTDRSLRGLTTLALIEPCLQQPAKVKKKLKK